MTTLQLIAAAWLLCGLSFLLGCVFASRGKRRALDEAYARGAGEGYRAGQNPEFVATMNDINRTLHKAETRRAR